MKSIGGYFGLELQRGRTVYHDAAHQFKSGRSALHAILNSTKPKLVYVPFYTCNALLTPLEEANVPYSFYNINSEFEPVALPALKKGEYFIYINYFDLKRSTVSELSRLFGDRLIVDNTQAFFMKGNDLSWFFNSCRKFFGVPDGSFLYAPQGQEVDNTTARNEGYVFDHLLSRFNGHITEGYPYFLQNEIACGSELYGMSKISEVLLSQVDFTTVAECRQRNFSHLHGYLKEFNQLQVEHDQPSVPMFYPLWLKKDINREDLYSKNIFIPVFWNDVAERKNKNFAFEVTLANQLLLLPIDHRYNEDDMDILKKSITSLL